MFKNFSYSLILASKSPRRQFLLQEAGFDFQVKSIDVDESFPDTLHSDEVANFIANNKAVVYRPYLKENEIVIVADTVVILNNIILGKPSNKEEAKEMLRALSGKQHTVITAVCLSSIQKTVAFDDRTLVHFKPLSDDEIDFYIENFKPYDKAGAYGAQEWMGMVAVEKIEGSYFNVMGLPVHRLYAELQKF